MKKSLLGELSGEVFGTFILVLLGVGVVANVGLAPRLAGPAYSWLAINLGWGFAVVVAVYAVGGVSGAHLNPAVTLAMAVKRGFPWNKVLPFWGAQLLGAFLGAVGVYLTYHDGLVAAGMPGIWVGGPGGIFSTTFWGGVKQATDQLGSYSDLNAAFAELIGTAVLLWGILGAFDAKNLGVGANLGPLFVGFAVMAVGLSLGGPSGYMINPARDLGPRIFGALVGSKGMFDGTYWFVGPILGCLIGGLVGVFTYDFFVTPYLPKPETAAKPEAAPEIAPKEIRQTA